MVVDVADKDRLPRKLYLKRAIVIYFKDSAFWRTFEVKSEFVSVVS